MTETVAWERWEGTIEYTFMAPLSRAMHLAGAGFFAVLYGLIRAIILFVVVAFFFDLALPNADFVAAFVVLVAGSLAFIGIGIMTAVLPLISPEKGAQLGFVAQGMLLVVSGVYYPVEVLPQWMQWLSVISPATYVLDGIREAILDGAGLSTMWDEIWPLLLIGAVAAPVGLWVFRRGEIYAKKHGKLKRGAAEPRAALPPDAASSVAPIATAIGAPCVLASERASHPGDERLTLLGVRLAEVFEATGPQAASAWGSSRFRGFLLTRMTRRKTAWG